MSGAKSQGTRNVARTLLVIIMALSGGVISVRAQQSEPSAASLKRIRDAVQNPQRLISSDVPLIGPSKPDDVQLGLGQLAASSAYCSQSHRFLHCYRQVVRQWPTS